MVSQYFSKVCRYHKTIKIGVILTIQIFAVMNSICCEFFLPNTIRHQIIHENLFSLTNPKIIWFLVALLVTIQGFPECQLLSRVQQCCILFSTLHEITYCRFLVVNWIDYLNGHRGNCVPYSGVSFLWDYEIITKKTVAKLSGGEIKKSDE